MRGEGRGDGRQSTGKEKGISDPHNTMFFFLRRIASSVSVAWKYRSVVANI